MFKLSFVRVYALSAIIVSVIAFGLTIFSAYIIPELQPMQWFSIVAALVSWFFLGWSGIIGNQLANKFELDEELCTKVGWRMLVVLGVFGVYIFFGFSLGIIIAIYIFYTIKNIRDNLEDWAREHPYEGFLRDDADTPSH